MGQTRHSTCYQVMVTRMILPNCGIHANIMRILGLNSKQQEWRVTFDQIKSINDDRIEIIEEGKKGFNDTAYCSTSE